MQKYLLFIMAGLVAFGTAFAEPKNGKPKVTPKTQAEKDAIREQTCKAHPDERVWVEKDKRCVQKITCLSASEDVNTNYCVGYGMNGSNNMSPLPVDEARYRPILEKYAKYYMNTTPEWIALEYAAGQPWLKMYTVDGDYKVFPGYDDHGDTIPALSIPVAAWAFGLDMHYTEDRDKFEVFYNKGVVSESLCAEVAEFSSFLDGSQITSKYEDDKCILVAM